MPFELFSGKTSASLEIQAELNKKETSTAQKMNFIRMASYEFRSPLSTILSSINLLDRYQETGDQAKAQKHVQKIKDVVGDMKNMLDYFLGISCAEYIQYKTEKLDFDKLSECCNKLITEISENLKEGQTLKFIARGRHTVTINKYYLASLLKNLLTNAIKFSCEQTSIKINLAVHEKDLRFTIEDLCTELSAEQFRSLQCKPAMPAGKEKYIGDGLNSYILTEYLGALNGILETRNNADNGYRIIVTIPSK